MGSKNEPRIKFTSFFEKSSEHAKKIYIILNFVIWQSTG